MGPGPYLFLPDDRRYDPLYAMVDRHSTIQFFDRNGRAYGLSVRVPVKVAKEYGIFVPLVAVCAVTDLTRPRVRYKAACAPAPGTPASNGYHATDAAIAKPGARKGGRGSSSNGSSTNGVPVSTADRRVNTAHVGRSGVVDAGNNHQPARPATARPTRL